LLYLDLDPQPLGVKPVLVALLVATHCVEALPEVFIGTAPGVVDAHWIVGGYWAVNEGPAFVGSVVAMQVLMQDAALVPPALHLLLEEGVVHTRWRGHWTEQLPSSGCRGVFGCTLANCALGAVLTLPGVIPSVIPSLIPGVITGAAACPRRLLVHRLAPLRLLRLLCHLSAPSRSQ